VNCEANHFDMVLAQGDSLLCKASEPMSVIAIVCPGRYSTEHRVRELQKQHAAKQERRAARQLRTSGYQEPLLR
jgi:hypothetical protein